MSETEKSGRVQWIDCAKGIAICLVVIGHSMVRSSDFTADDIVRGIIFSFHMPLFFFCSGLMMHLSVSEKQVIRGFEKSAIKLLLPMIIVYSCLRIYYIIAFGFDKSIGLKGYLSEYINILVYSSDVEIADIGVPALGRLWFLAALFCGKNLFDYLHFKVGDKTITPVCIILCIIGMCFGKVQWLPLSLDISLAAMIFFLFGYSFRKIDISKQPIARGAAVTLIWMVLFIIIYYESGHYRELATREYPLGPLSIICAIFGILSIAYFSFLISKLRLVSKPLSFLGRNTMMIYCVHAADVILNNMWNVTEFSGINALLHLAVVLCVACVILLLKRCIIAVSKR